VDNARLMPLTANLTTLLKDLYKVCYLLEPHVVLANGKSVYSIKTAFKASCRCAKLQGFRFHDFRHIAVTNMQITGHKTLEVFKRYNSLLEGDLNDAAHCLNSCLALAHQGEKSETHKSAINQTTRP
jgi:integrase